MKAFSEGDSCFFESGGTYYTYTNEVRHNLVRCNVVRVTKRHVLVSVGFTDQGPFFRFQPDGSDYYPRPKKIRGEDRHYPWLKHATMELSARYEAERRRSYVLGYPLAHLNDTNIEYLYNVLRTHCD